MHISEVRQNPFVALRKKHSRPIKTGIVALVALQNRKYEGVRVMVSQKELLERALKGLAGLTHLPEQKPPELARTRPTTESELPPDVAEAIAAYRQVFDVKAVRVVGPDEERGILYKRWMMDQITGKSEEYLADFTPLPIDPIPIPENAKPPKPDMGARTSLEPEILLQQLSMDLQPKRAACGDVEPDCLAGQHHGSAEFGVPRVPKAS
jgi:hypothetical protein